MSVYENVLYTFFFITRGKKNANFVEGTFLLA